MLKSWQALFFASILLITPACALAQVENEKTVKVIGTNFTLNYTTTGNIKITDIHLDTVGGELVISVNAQTNSDVTLTLPRELIDNKRNGTDVAFPYFYPGNDVIDRALEKKDTPIDRTITIPFEQGNSTIGLGGSHLVPEFSSTLSMVLLLSVIGMILIYSRFKTRP